MGRLVFSPLDSGAVVQPRRIPLSAPHLTGVEKSYVDEALASGWISGTGPFVTRFEERVAQRVGRRHTIAVANGTLAIEVALRALGVGHGDEVIVPALTFAAPALSVLAVGATPVLADVTRETWTLAPTAAASAMSAATRAVIAVDVLGHPADYDALCGLGVPIIEDAAEAHGARYKGKLTGGLGDLSIFSFHANKAITTGEGGCVCTDSDEIAEQIRLIVNHGMTAQRPYVHPVVGRNFRMTSLTAAVGLGQMDRWEELLAARAAVASRYDDLLADLCESRPVAAWASYSCWLHTVLVDTERREKVLIGLRERGIDARAIWPSLADQPVLAGAGPPSDLPVAGEISRRAIWLPTHAGLADDDIRYTAQALRDVFTQAAR